MVRVKQTTEKLRQTGGRVLIIQTAFIGDVILMTPLIRVLRTYFPKVEIGTLTVPACSGLIREMVDFPLEFNKHDSSHKNVEVANTISRLKSLNFDLALIPHRSFTSGWLARQAGIPVRIGFKKGSGSIFHNVTVPYPPHLYEGKRNLALWQGLIDVADDGLPELAIPTRDQSLVGNILESLQLRSKPYVVFAPGSVWTTKRWLESHYLALRKKLELDPELTVLAVGGAADRALCDRLVSRSEYNLAGQLSLLQSAELIRQARCLISGDSAPAHLATAMRTNQVIILGSTVPGFGFVPRLDSVRLAEVKLWCRPCTSHGRQKCPLWTKLRCLKEISPFLVQNLIKDWI